MLAHCNISAQTLWRECSKFVNVCSLLMLTSSIKIPLAIVKSVRMFKIFSSNVCARSSPTRLSQSIDSLSIFILIRFYACGKYEFANLHLSEKFSFATVWANDSPIKRAKKKTQLIEVCYCLAQNDQNAESETWKVIALSSNIMDDKTFERFFVPFRCVDSYAFALCPPPHHSCCEKWRAADFSFFHSLALCETKWSGKTKV